MDYVDPTLVVLTDPDNQLHELFMFEDGELPSPSSEVESKNLNTQDEAPALGRTESGSSASSSVQGSKEQVRRHKRKEQNRHAQRLYRERKVQRITDLEKRIMSLRAGLSELRQENSEMELQIYRIKIENEGLRSSLVGSPEYEAAAGHAPRRKPETRILLKHALTVYGGCYHDKSG